jgi:hypothetical protein
MERPRQPGPLFTRFWDSLLRTSSFQPAGAGAGEAGDGGVLPPLRGCSSTDVFAVCRRGVNGTGVGTGSLSSLALPPHPRARM